MRSSVSFRRSAVAYMQVLCERGGSRIYCDSWKRQERKEREKVEGTKNPLSTSSTPVRPFTDTYPGHQRQIHCRLTHISSGDAPALATS